MCETGRLRAVESAYLLERATARARKQLAALKRHADGALSVPPPAAPGGHAHHPEAQLGAT